MPIKVTIVSITYAVSGDIGAEQRTPGAAWKQRHATRSELATPAPAAQSDQAERGGQQRNPTRRAASRYAAATARVFLGFVSGLVAGVLLRNDDAARAAERCVPAAPRRRLVAGAAAGVGSRVAARCGLAARGR